MPMYMFYNYCSIVCRCMHVCLYLPIQLCSIRKIHDFIMYTILRRFIKSDSSSNVDRSFSLPIFLESICYARSRIYHMPVSRPYTINRVHITPLLLPSSYNTIVVTAAATVATTTATTQQQYSVFELANRWLIRLPGFLVPPSFVRSFTGNMTETRKHKLCI